MIAIVMTDADIDEMADLLAAQELAKKVADMTGSTYADVWDGMIHMPEYLLALLKSPIGCTALAKFIAPQVGEFVGEEAIFTCH